MPDIELVPGRILVAEDSPTTQILIRSVLRGWVVDIASDGAEALHLFQNRDYDLILMDIEMPDMDGRQAAQAIRSFEKEFARVADGIGDPTLLKSIPILAMSAHSGDLIEDPAMDRFFDDFIPKPINKREMLAKVNKWTARCQAQAEDCRKEHAKTETIVENTPI
ncbi:MAG: response regulator, partial [Syntrophobacteraceae bacterium]